MCSHPTSLYVYGAEGYRHGVGLFWCCDWAETHGTHEAHGIIANISLEARVKLHHQSCIVTDVSSRSLVRAVVCNTLSLLTI